MPRAKKASLTTGKGVTVDADPTSKRLTKRDHIVGELRARIASGEIPRGARLQQDDLAAQFDTSITPVREALRQLEAEGLLVGEPHRGVRVSNTNVDEQHGVYVARRLLEPFATQLATQHISRRDIAQARQLVVDMDEAGQRGDLSAVRKANRGFHFLLYDRCEIPSLVGIIEGVWDAFPWDTLEVLNPRAAQSVEDHNAILDRLDVGDVIGVGTSMENHIVRSHEQLVKHLTGEHLPDDPFDTVRTET